MILFYFLPVIWLLSQCYLYYRGHYPSHLCTIKVPLTLGSVWLGIASVWHHHESWMIYVGFLVPMLASTLMVPVILSDYRGLAVLALLQVLGYVVLCVGFCVGGDAATACVCGGCFVLVVLYASRLVAADARVTEGFIEI